jgi:hypothetical protein
VTLAGAMEKPWRVFGLGLVAALIAAQAWAQSSAATWPDGPTLTVLTQHPDLNSIGQFAGPVLVPPSDSAVYANVSVMDPGGIIGTPAEYRIMLQGPVDLIIVEGDRGSDVYDSLEKCAHPIEPNCDPDRNEYYRGLQVKGIPATVDHYTGFRGENSWTVWWFDSSVNVTYSLMLQGAQPGAQALAFGLQHGGNTASAPRFADLASNLVRWDDGVKPTNSAPTDDAPQATPPATGGANTVLQ